MEKATHIVSLPGKIYEGIVWELEDGGNYFKGRLRGGSEEIEGKFPVVPILEKNDAKKD